MRLRFPYRKRKKYARHFLRLRLVRTRLVRWNWVTAVVTHFSTPSERKRKSVMNIISRSNFLCVSINPVGLSYEEPLDMSIFLPLAVVPVQHIILMSRRSGQCHMPTAWIIRQCPASCVLRPAERRMFRRTAKLRSPHPIHVLHPDVLP